MSGFKIILGSEILLCFDFYIGFLYWHYSERGHGKGAVDGVGGQTKRLADSLVAQGIDLPNLEALANALMNKDSKINIRVIEPKEIKSIDKILEEKKLIPFVGTLKIHQLAWKKEEDYLQARALTCSTCSANEVCKHYHLGKIKTDGVSEPIYENPVAASKVNANKPLTRGRKRVNEEDGLYNGGKDFPNKKVYEDKEIAASEGTGSEYDKENFQMKDFVIVEVDDKSVVLGQIIKIGARTITIKKLEKCPKSGNWRWPKKATQKSFKWVNITKKVTVTKTSNRGYYAVN